jgi:hypothetical protein
MWNANLMQQCNFIDIFLAQQCNFIDIFLAQQCNFIDIFLAGHVSGYIRPSSGALDVELQHMVLCTEVFWMGGGLESC